MAKPGDWYWLDYPSCVLDGLVARKVGSLFTKRRLLVPLSFSGTNAGCLLVDLNDDSSGRFRPVAKPYSERRARLDNESSASLVLEAIYGSIRAHERPRGEDYLVTIHIDGLATLDGPGGLVDRWPGAAKP